MGKFNSFVCPSSCVDEGTGKAIFFFGGRGFLTSFFYQVITAHGISSVPLGKARRPPALRR
jgi:hypothetical protein